MTTGFYENKRGEHALHIACQNGNLDSVRTLLRNGAALNGNANGTNSDGRTVLHTAAFSGQEEIVRMLLCHFNYDPATSTDIKHAGSHADEARGQTSSSQVTEGKRNNNSSIDATTASISASSNNSMSNQNIIHSKDNDGKTALLISIEQGHINIIKLLLENGANVHDTDKDKNTALHFAARNKYGIKKHQEHIVKLLLDKGVRPYGKNNHHKTPLHQACSTGNLAIVQMLLTNNSNIKIKNTSIHNPIHDKDKKRNNALHIASFKGHTQIVKLLIRHGANIHYKNTHGCTALDIANYNQHTQIVELLLGKKYTKIYNTMLKQKQDGDVYFYDHQNYARAEKIYQKVLHLGNQDEHSYSKQPWMYNTTRRKLHAVLHCQRAICLMRLARYDEALEECNVTLDICKHFQNAILTKARCFAHFEKHEESLWEYNRYIHLVKDSVIVKNDEADVNSSRDVDASIDETNIDEVTPNIIATTFTPHEKNNKHKHEYKNGIHTTNTTTTTTPHVANNNNDLIPVADSEYQAILMELSNVQVKQKSKEEHKKEQEQYHQQFPSRIDSFGNTRSSPKPHNTKQRKTSKKKVGNNIIMNLQDKPNSRLTGARHRNHSTTSTNTASTTTSTISSSSSVAHHYAVLQIQAKDSDSRIKKAYQQMALQYQNMK